jgi:hypothetical protein
MAQAPNNPINFFMLTSKHVASSQFEQYKHAMRKNYWTAKDKPLDLRKKIAPRDPYQRES